MPVTTGDRLRIGFRAIFWFVLVLLALICVPVVWGVSPLLVLGAALLALLLALPAWGVRRLFAGVLDKPSYWVTWLATAAMLVCAMGLPVYWLAYRSGAEPLVLPKATLTNGEKTVIFQGMVHVGSEDFYKSVVHDLEAALADGYDLFYEGVQAADDQADQWFAEYMGSGDDPNAMHRLLSGMCGIQFQLDYFGLLEADQRVHPDRHVTADVDHRDMMDEYRRLHPTAPWHPGQADDDGVIAEAAADAVLTVLEYTQGGSDSRRQVGGIACRAMLNHALKNDAPDPEKHPIVLDFRNHNLVETIVDHPGDRIFVTYGAAHLPGVIGLLKAEDPDWKVTSVKWLRGIEPPRQYDGELRVDG